MTRVIAATQFFQKTDIFISVQHKGAKGKILFLVLYVRSMPALPVVRISSIYHTAQGCIAFSGS